MGQPGGGKRKRSGKREASTGNERGLTQRNSEKLVCLLIGANYAFCAATTRTTADEKGGYRSFWVSGKPLPPHPSKETRGIKIPGT